MNEASKRRINKLGRLINVSKEATRLIKSGGAANEAEAGKLLCVAAVLTDRLANEWLAETGGIEPDQLH